MCFLLSQVAVLMFKFTVHVVFWFNFTLNKSVEKEKSMGLIYIHLFAIVNNKSCCIIIVRSYRNLPEI